jgi:hypothetical protein
VVCIYVEGLEGNPQNPTIQPPDHDGHEIVHATGQGLTGQMLGFLVCNTCTVLVDRLTLCLTPAKRGAPSQVTVRTDLGYSKCWSHGEGAGRTNTPRRRTV